jgi:NADH dehydrogenase FAD-containing subunit
VVVGGGYVGMGLACKLSKIIPKHTKLTIQHNNAMGVCSGAVVLKHHIKRHNND